MPAEGDPAVWVVAGCLFEVSLPEVAAVPWQWRGPCAEVTLLAETVRDGRRHFRFRAEGAGADAGAVVLRFRSGEAERAVAVRIAPEEDGR